jgi:hypothetical protein
MPALRGFSYFCLNVSYFLIFKRAKSSFYTDELKRSFFFVPLEFFFIKLVLLYVHFRVVLQSLQVCLVPISFFISFSYIYVKVCFRHT